MKISLRTKITICFISVILVSGLITTFAGIHFIGNEIIKQAQSKVRLDLNTAHELYRNRLESIKTIIEFTAIRPSVKKALLERDRLLLKSRLDQVRYEGDIDILSITDSHGNVILRSQNPSIYGDSVIHYPIIKRVISEKHSFYATEIILSKDLQKEGDEFAKRAHIELIPTPKTSPMVRKEQRDGMMLMVAVPVLDDQGKMFGIIYGGKLLDRDYEIVDRIKDIVYRDERYGGRDIGTATIFQGDLRISTNVIGKDGKRAVGTRVSEEVNEQVLKRGKPWIAEAFVVDSWYITAYEPIYDLNENIIGILYVGMLKKPFDVARIKIISIFLGIVLMGVILVIVAANFLTARICQPLRKMQQTAYEIAAGDYSKDIEVKSTDEVGELAESFNKMTKKLLNVQNELRKWGDTLEDKVEERTLKLKEMQNQLVQAEKMASIGGLAAGVAHEINNPLTGVLTISSLMLEKLEPDSKLYHDIKIIVDETMRCREIVKGLLDFSHQTTPQKVPVHMNKLIESVIVLVQNQASFRNIDIQKELSDSLPEIMVDQNQMMQVFMNILINSAEAMPEGGKIRIQSLFEKSRNLINIKFVDTGLGINKEKINKIFDPFFSTKEKGTGLGLSISYGIVKNHGGSIEVDSEQGRGSSFVIRLPLT